MALIPSESLSFPDSFRATIGWRVTKQPHSAPENLAAAASPESDALSFQEDTTTSDQKAEPVRGPEPHRRDLGSKVRARTTRPPRTMAAAEVANEPVAAEVRPEHVLEKEGETITESVNAAAVASDVNEPEAISELPPRERVEVVPRSLQEPSIEASAAKTSEAVPKLETTPASLESSVRAETSPPAQAEFFPTAPPEIPRSPVPPKIPAKIRIAPRKKVHQGPVRAPTDPREPSPSLQPRAPEISAQETEPVAPKLDLEPRETTDAASDLSPPSEPRAETAATRPRRARPMPAHVPFFPDHGRRARKLRFAMAEGIAIAGLIALALVPILRPASDRVILVLVAIVMAGLLALAIALPIIFLRNDPSRWSRDR